MNLERVNPNICLYGHTSTNVVEVSHNNDTRYRGPVDGIHSFLQNAYSKFVDYHNDACNLIRLNEYVTRYATGNLTYNLTYYLIYYLWPYLDAVLKLRGGYDKGSPKTLALRYFDVIAERLDVTIKDSSANVRLISFFLGNGIEHGETHWSIKVPFR